MDTINVSSDGLQQAYTALQNFRDNTQAITKLCADLIESKNSLIDDTFRKDLVSYVEVLSAWSAFVEEYAGQNQQAILDRQAALEAYCATPYIKRTN